MHRLCQATTLALFMATSACGKLPMAGGTPIASSLAAAMGVRAPASALRLVTLPDAGDAFFLDALRQARTSIKLQVYLLTHAGVIAELGSARKRGVDVQVILERQPFNQPKVAGPGGKGSLPANQAAAAKLAAQGVTVTWASDAFAFTHAKAVTIDHEVTYVSTANFTRSGLNADGDGSREYMVEDRNPADVKAFVALFDGDRLHTRAAVADPNLVVSPDNARARLFALVGAAKHSVTIQVEVAGDPALDALLASRVKAGVQVHALLADLGGHKTPNGGANGDTAKAWLELGAQVRYQDKPHLHGKAIVVDGSVAYVGSENLTTNSLDNNRELGLLVSQADVVEGLASTFERDWAGARATTQKSPIHVPRQHRNHTIGLAPTDPGFDDGSDDDDSDSIDEDAV